MEKLQEYKVKEQYKRKVKEKTDKVFDCVNDYSLEEVWGIMKNSMAQMATVCGLARRKRGS